ncbi:hypothetical protein OOK44_28045 [Streptomyces cellulosae]|uniref:hypothetical protein n=1 Tax=Streptomyces cellulosae TaxID=1968 RepID=UPI00224F12DA|nr:hypothetical protein [Streptomyces cellulosae]WTC55050.1 hypothetical protein OH715_07070 [Streptomyces cellulosae]
MTPFDVSSGSGPARLVAVIACPSPKCSSPNVADLPHYWQSLPSESPLKAKYAPPARPKVSYWAAVGASVAGVLVITGGGVLLGLLLFVGRRRLGRGRVQGSAVAQAQRAAWESSHVCLACTGTF